MPMNLTDALKSLVNACVADEQSKNTLYSKVTQDNFIAILGYAAQQNNPFAAEAILRFPLAGGLLVTNKTAENPFYIALQKSGYSETAQLIDKKVPYRQLWRLQITVNGSDLFIKDSFPQAYQEAQSRATATAATYRPSQAPPRPRTSLSSGNHPTNRFVQR